MPGFTPRTHIKRQTKALLTLSLFTGGGKTTQRANSGTRGSLLSPAPTGAGLLGQDFPLTPAGPLPERVAARSGANTCGTHTAAAAGSTEPD